MNQDRLRHYAARMYDELQGRYVSIMEPAENLVLELAKYPYPEWDGATELNARSYGVEFFEGDLEAIAAAFAVPDGVQPSLERVEMDSSKLRYYVQAKWRWVE